MALISRYHTEASGNTIFAANYNGEFDNIINNGLIPSGIVADGAANVTAMRAISNPGAVGAESLPVSLSDEIRQIHYVIKTLSGGAQWYDVSGGALGNVAGAASSTDNAVTRFNGTTGKSIQNSGVIIDDSNNVSGIGTLSAGATTVTDLSSTGNTTLGNAADDTITITAATSVSVSSAFGNGCHDVVTRATGTSVGVRGVAIGSNSGAGTITGTSYTDITSGAATITTSGRPVFITIAASGADAGLGINSQILTGDRSAYFRLVRNSTEIAQFKITHNVATTGVAYNRMPGISHVDAVAAGTYAYKLQAKADASIGTSYSNVCVVAYEL